MYRPFSTQRTLVHNNSILHPFTLLACTTKDVPLEQYWLAARASSIPLPPSPRFGSSHTCRPNLSRISGKWCTLLSAGLNFPFLAFDTFEDLPCKVCLIVRVNFGSISHV